MTEQETHPVVLALLSRPQEHRVVVEKLGFVHGFGTVVTVNAGEFWRRFAHRKPDVVLLERGHLEQCRSLLGLGCACVVIHDEALSDPDVIMDRFMDAAAAGARGVCFSPVSDTTLANMLNAAMTSKGEVALSGRRR